MNVKVADFGVSIIYNKMNGLSCAPEEGSRSGLVDGSLDTSIDVFSYGMILWELVTGMPGDCA